jgi:hypothetical protein
MSSAPEPAGTPPEPRQRFPFVTVIATLAVLFAFLGLMVLAYRSPNALETPRPATTDAKEEEPKLDAAAKLDEVKNRNDAALAGVGAKMTRDEARRKLLATLKGPNDKLPFPTPEPPVVAAPAPKKDDKKEDKKDGKEDKKGDAEEKQ